MLLQRLELPEMHYKKTTHMKSFVFLRERTIAFDTSNPCCMVNFFDRPAKGEHVCQYNGQQISEIASNVFVAED